jgi:hypothetical protein
MGIRAVKIDISDIVKPQHRLSSRAGPRKNPPELFEVAWRNPPVSMDEVGIDRQQDHSCFLIEVRQLIRIARQCGGSFKGLGFPLLGGFYYIR